MVRISSPRPLKRPSLSKAAVLPQKIVGGRRKAVPVGTELEILFAAVGVEIACDDAVLQHAREHDAVAARRPGELPGQREVGGQQHGGRKRHGGTG
jgi:hypothetical protein